MPRPPQDLRQLSSLLQIISDLRGPEGCPWDKEQTHLSLTPYAIEETAELVEALESGDDSKTKDELGDVLFQVVLHCQLAQERGAFDFAGVIENLSAKMIRRHPHVFADVSVNNSSDVIKNWDEIKKAEKKAAGLSTDPAANTLDVPTGLPALQRAAKIGARTRKLKFDWPNAEGVLEKVREEIQEMEEALDLGQDDELRHEIGDVFFSLAQLARHLGYDPEQIAREANRRFESRFATMMRLCREQGLTWETLSDHEKEQLWVQAKVLEKTAASR